MSSEHPDRIRAATSPWRRWRVENWLFGIFLCVSALMLFAFGVAHFHTTHDPKIALDLSHLRPMQMPNPGTMTTPAPTPPRSTLE